MKGQRYTFMVSILALFGCLTLILSIFLISNFYARSLNQAYELLQQNNTETTRHVAESLRSSLYGAQRQLQVLQALDQEADISDSETLLQRVMWQQLGSDASIASLFMADQQGSFIQVRREPELALRTINRSVPNPQDVWTYKDPSFQTLRVESLAADYDPRPRSWYQAVTAQSPAYWSDPYLFASTGAPGITLALGQFAADGQKTKVAAVDFSLQGMQRLLQEKAAQLGGQLVMLGAGDEVIATTLPLDWQDGLLLNVAQAGSPLLQQLHQQQRFGVSRGELMDEAGRTQIFFISELPGEAGRRWYLIALFDKAEVIGDIRQQLLRNVLISILVILLTYVPLQAMLRRYVIRPVQKLDAMTHAIARQEYDRVEPLETRIHEFHQLSRSMVNMAGAIRQYQEDQKNLIDSFIRILAEAIDDKSHYTGGHCERVPEVALLLAEAADQCQQGTLADFRFHNDDEWREFRVAAWLHDCGKIITPEHVVDKATKLETIYNRIHEIRMRFEVLHRDATLTYYQQLLQKPQHEAQLATTLQQHHQALQEAFAFVARCNQGGEFMADEDLVRLQTIAGWQWQRHFDDRLGLGQDEILRLQGEPGVLPVTEPLLADRQEHRIPRGRAIDLKEYQRLGFKMQVPEYERNLGELYNLSVRRGTLTEEDRFIIKGHMIATIKMLERIPFTDNLKRVPEYAGSHHETLIGTGYPRQLVKEQLSIPARIMAIADVFEALTASDRPYKKAKPLSESLKIMAFMRNDGHLDPELFDLFLTSGVYQTYAERFLAPEQMDVADITPYLAAA
ncbi:HD domain-containing phosphohydrolase [Marinospirillum alkaliphilum]|uniref:HD-GYP domain, c-di-GMP phosphodiesterase class II (Or its inactivated variant) n=1 Tax=Marinospirillum alkaliphilum DSM 21637 TaxID=1122209 RepID=A0A1K1WMZ1_9GAMM|nr:HD domain-containing phosphohydrolase [Marinospirillum alkaliphilum]SFX38754.1 HD-GYP domain, c-di-GMP phosphodiesterase class II (or its inactivated variant) [Marinospirillum alkaliphilum DSM 21637]